jgi:hypothetical protein
LPRRLGAIPQPSVVDVVACVALGTSVVRAVAGEDLTEETERELEGAEVGTGVGGRAVGLAREEVLHVIGGAGAEATVGVVRGVAHPAPNTSTSAAAQSRDSSLLLISKV